MSSKYSHVNKTKNNNALFIAIRRIGLQSHIFNVKNNIYVETQYIK